MSSESAPQWDSLPTPALECIFQGCHTNQLARLRLVCRHWNSAICHSPSLMGSLIPRFTGAESVFQKVGHAKQLKMVTASTSRFREAFVDAANMDVMARGSPLWAQIGRTIRTLHVSGNRDEVFEVANLLEVLRAVPNLLRLDVTVNVEMVESLYFENTLDNNLKLERLEILFVDDLRLIGLFNGICSNLKDFKFDHPDEELYFVEDVMPLIYAHQDSLQKISLHGQCENCVKLLKEISSAGGLRLKEFSVRIERDSRELNDQLINFCGSFPTIE